MRKSVFIIFLLFLIICADKSSAQFELNKHYIGPSVGLSFLGSTFQIGINYEYALHRDNFGKIGIGGIFRYWSYSEAFPGGKFSYSDVLIGVQGNYHFQLPDTRFDPYAGLVLAYDAGTVDWSGDGIERDTPVYGGFWIGVHGGLRYWFTPTVALNARIGFGTLSYGALDIGVDFKLP
jgi:hypothetical protein